MSWYFILLLTLWVGWLCTALASAEREPGQGVVPVDWLDRQPAPAPSPERIRFLQREDERKVLAQQPAAVPGSRHRSIFTTDFIVQDQSQNVWAFMVDGKAFSKWDGLVWQDQPLPDAVAEYNSPSTNFAADANGQAWLWPVDGGPASVLDFASGLWQFYESLREAVAARLVPGDCMESQIGIMPCPVSHLNGTKALLYSSKHVEVLRAGLWHSTSLVEFFGEQPGINRPFAFTQGGDLCLQLNSRYYAFGDGDIWKEVPANTTIPLKDTSLIEPGPKLPEISSIQSSLWDRTGAAWIVGRDCRLYKWREGHLIAMMDGEKPLMLPNSWVHEVLIDRFGNAFIGNPPGRRYEFVASQPRTPNQAATIEIEKGGLVSIKSPQAGGWRRCRKDGEPWSKLTREQQMAPVELLPGKHQIEMEVLDEEFTLIEPTQKWEVVIEALPAAELRQRILLLGSQGMERNEEVARILVNQGSSAIPELKKALLDVNIEENQQWWLRAVIQRIEREVEVKR